MKLLTRLFALLIASVSIPSLSFAECGAELRIVRVDALAFGRIATAREGGVVVVSPNGAVATLGGIGAGPGAQAGAIQLCGPAGARFALLIDPPEVDIAGRHYGPHLVSNVEILAYGAVIHPVSAGQWEGQLGPSGRADLRVGGTLTVPSNQNHDSFAAQFRIAVLPAP